MAGRISPAYITLELSVDDQDTLLLDTGRRAASLLHLLQASGMCCLQIEGCLAGPPTILRMGDHYI